MKPLVTYTGAWPIENLSIWPSYASRPSHYSTTISILRTSARSIYQIKSESHEIIKYYNALLLSIEMYTQAGPNPVVRPLIQIRQKIINAERIMKCDNYNNVMIIYKQRFLFAKKVTFLIFSTVAWLLKIRISKLLYWFQ